MSARHIAIIAAGTGGHIIPGIELGRHLIERGHRVTWLRGTRAVEGRMYAAAGINAIAVPWNIGSLRLTALPGLARAAAGAWATGGRLLDMNRPDAVVSMGGGFSAPVLARMALAGVPIFLHDSNACVGRVTRMFAGLARHVFLGVPANLDRANAHVTGTPTRAMPEWQKPGRMELLILGGSQGSDPVNRLAVAAGEALASRGIDFRIRLVGAKPGSFTPAPWLEVLESVPNPGELMAASRLAISRAGASTLAELARVGLPAILIPYPHAKDDHQSANARIHASAGAAEVLSESGCTGENLAEIILDIDRTPDRLTRMSTAARGLHRPDAAETIERLIMEVLEGRPTVPAGSMAKRASAT